MLDSHQQFEGVVHGLRGGINHKSSPTGARLDQPLLSQGLHGFTDRCAAGTELLSQFVLGGETIPSAQFTPEDALLDLLGDLLVQFACSYRGIHVLSLNSRDHTYISMMIILNYDSINILRLGLFVKLLHCCLLFSEGKSMLWEDHDIFAAPLVRNNFVDQ